MKLEDTLQKQNESTKIILKYPDRVPVIVNKCNKSTLNKLKKNKFLVEKDMTFTNFIFTIRKNIELDKSHALFTLVNNTLVNGNQTMGEIYNDHKNEDGFLYVVYTSENTFG